MDTQREVLERLEAGDVLTLEHVTEGRSRFFMEADGATVAPQVVRRLLAKGKIAGCGDKLFGDSQTYELVRKD